MSEMKIGFSMHPRWLGGAGLLSFTAPMRATGLSVLEFELDDHLQLWDEFDPLITEAVEKGFDLSFHAPYRPPHNLCGYSGERRAEIEMDQRPLLDIAAGWAQRTGAPKTVVIHAATGPLGANIERLETDTVDFLEFALRTYPDLRFALENNHPALIDRIKIGVRREDVLRIIERVAHPNLRACWDLGHDYLSGSADAPDAAWLRQVAHVHLHDVDAGGTDHYPLIYGNVPFRPWLQELKRVGMNGIIVLELKGDLLRGWPIDCILTTLTDSVREIAREIA